MKTIEEAAKEYGRKVSPQSDWTARNAEISFKAGVEFAQRWIPVEEELPEVYSPVLAVIKTPNQTWVEEIGYNDGYFELPGRGYTKYVTHWMYLPKPPKQQEASEQQEAFEQPEQQEELKAGDLVICWDSDEGCAIIAEFVKYYNHEIFGRYETPLTFYNHAIKFESIEQYRKLLKGEI